MYHNCQELTAYSCDPCGATENGRIGAFALVKNSVTILNPSNATEWTTLETNGNAKIIREIRGQGDGGAPVVVPGFGRSVEKVTGMNHTLTFHDEKTLQNIAFYNNLIDQAKNYKLWYVTETQIWQVLGEISFTPKKPIGEDPSSSILIEGSIKWAYKFMETSYDKPGTFFETCS
jgi:hypothetical protein